MSVGTANRIKIARMIDGLTGPHARPLRPRPRRAGATPGNAGRPSGNLRRRRIGKLREQCRETIRQLLQIASAQAAHRALQCPDSAPGSCPQYLLAIRGGMDLHASLIPFMPAPLDPAARDEAFQHVAHRRSLHSKACGQPRRRNPRFFTDARQRAMHRDWRIGHAFEFAIERAHAIDQRARRQQRIAFEGASPGEAVCIAGDSLSG